MPFGVERCTPETSPHTRGELCHCALIICLSQKHPRIRGENLSESNVTPKAIETSPHTRGELHGAKNIPVR